MWSLLSLLCSLFGSFGESIRARKRAETASAIWREKGSLWGWWIFLLDLDFLYISLLFVVSSCHAQDGSWADSACETKLGYVCKRKPLAEEPGEAEVTYPGCQKVSVKQKQRKVIVSYFHSYDGITEVNYFDCSWWSPGKLLIRMYGYFSD